MEKALTVFSLTGYSAEKLPGPPRGGARHRTPMASCPDAKWRHSFFSTWVLFL